MSFKKFEVICLSFGYKHWHANFGKDNARGQTSGGLEKSDALPYFYLPRGSHHKALFLQSSTHWPPLLQQPFVFIPSLRYKPWKLFSNGVLLRPLCRAEASGGAKLAAVQRWRGEMELVAPWHGAGRGRANPAEV
jgi:hypothetical protein